MIIEIYQHFIYYILILLSLSFIVLLVVNIKNIKYQFANIKRKTWLLLLLIFLVGLLIRILLPHYHVMYIDEPWYMEMAKNFNEQQEPVVCQYNVFGEQRCWTPFKAPLWPFILSLFQLIAGLGSYPALYFGSFIGSLTIVLLFALGYIISRDVRPALFAAAMLSIMPLHVKWSNSIETNMLSLLFTLITLISFYIFLRKPNLHIFMLLLLSTILTICSRFELILLPFIMCFVYFIPRFKIVNRCLLGIIFLISLFFIQSIMLFLFRSSMIDMDSIFLALPWYILDISYYLLLIIPILLLKLKKDRYISSLLIFLVFITIHYIPLYNPLESRMALIPLSLMVLVASFYMMQSRYRLHRFIVPIVIILISAGFIGYTIDESKLLETEFIDHIRYMIPKNSFVVQEFPTILSSVSYIKGINTIEALAQNISVDSDVYYLYDGYCTLDGVALWGYFQKYSVKRCHEMIDRYDMEVILVYSSGDIQYRLMKMNRYSD